MGMIASLLGRPAIAPHLLLGRQGEQVAAAYLRSVGYRVDEVNVRVGRHDEIDLIAFDPSDEVLVFVEVKTTAQWDERFPPEMRLDHRKRRALSRAAQGWVTRQEYDGAFRIDLVCVAGGKVVDHFKEIGGG
ncbi:MAG: hypothetical protein Greene041619_493 [Candidatus Peregrinibacteria bacterium Greene0416_19]|nr:MAG: hypothetical protein Greene041619_493 [Candidatus Peregrinibacteria bacterium Greene0416_19]